MQEGASSRGSVGHLSAVFTSCLATGIVMWASLTLARDIKVSGGLTTSYEYSDRQYDKEDGSDTEESTGERASSTTAANSAGDYNRLRMSPMIAVSSVSARDDLVLRYLPSFRYDMANYDHDIDHDLTATLKRAISSNWALKLNERYLLTDKTADATATAVADDTARLSDTAERRRYWTNDLGFVSDYTYGQDRLLSLGYSLGNLRHIDADPDGNLEDYDRHAATLTAGHRFDAVWAVNVAGGYVRGLYDAIRQDTEQEEAVEALQDRNLHEYHGSMVVDSRIIDHHPLSLTYNYLGVVYDAADRDNLALHDLTGGWQWDIAKNFTLNLGTGPSVQVTEGQSGEWGYNANAKVKYALERGAFLLSANRGFEVQNFTGAEESGRREFWQSRFDFNYQVLQNVQFALFTLYRNEDLEEVTAQYLAEGQSEASSGEENSIVTETDTIKRRRLSTGSSLGYRFAQWYTMKLTYDYLRQDSDKENDSFDEHRLILSLAAEMELFTW
ncbi:MAG: hypothetical protein OEL83_02555 [Desulforhopalus sp.]|nr:hypothetical protein [Desulforhopalus sp.]